MSPETSTFIIPYKRFAATAPSSSSSSSSGSSRRLSPCDLFHSCRARRCILYLYIRVYLTSLSAAAANNDDDDDDVAASQERERQRENKKTHENTRARMRSPTIVSRCFTRHVFRHSVAANRPAVRSTVVVASYIGTYG